MSKSAKHNETRTIDLTNGYQAIIDAADFEAVNKFKWFAKKPRANDGEIYAARSVREGKKVRTIFMHRFIMNCPVGMKVDHGNKNRLDNHRANLEIVTRQENLRRRGVYKRCTSAKKN